MASMSSSNLCQFHSSVQSKSDTLSKSYDSLSKDVEISKYGTFGIDLIAHVNEIANGKFFESLQIICSASSKLQRLKSEVIPIIKHNVQSNKDQIYKQQMTPLVDGYDTLLDELDTCSIKNGMETIKADMEKMKAQMIQMKTQVDQIPQMKAQIDRIPQMEAQIDRIPQMEAQIGRIPQMEAQIDRIPLMEAQIGRIPQMEAQIDRIPLMEAKIAKLEAEKEVRAWIDEARELIIKQLETKFKNEFTQLKSKSKSDIHWNDWMTLARSDDSNTSRYINEGIYEIAKSLFELNTEEWKTISINLYGELSHNFHSRRYSLNEAEKMVDIVVKESKTKISMKKMFKKIDKPDQK
jgi:hypothetical protein